LALAYAAPVGPVHVAAGPAVEALLRPLVLEFAGTEVSRIPTLVAVLSVEVRVP
jgi:hypothetical protein